MTQEGQKNLRTIIILPAFNEARIIGSVINKIKKNGWSEIVVVDDASTDGTSRVAREAGALVTRHIINRGKGAALRTGFEIAKKCNADIVVTLDADGQHAPEEISEVVAPLQMGTHDAALGTRSFSIKQMGVEKALANISANILTFCLYGVWVRDSQSGFRAFTKKVLETIHTRFDHYEYETEIVGELARHKLPFIQVPISTTYTLYSTTKAQRQTFMRGMKTAAKLFLYN